MLGVTSLLSAPDQIRLCGENTMSTLRDLLLRTLGDQGIRLNEVKTKIYTPQSNKMREINGVTYTPDGRRGVSQVKKAAFERLFRDLADILDETLIKNPYYAAQYGIKGGWENKIVSLDAEKILRALDGRYRAYLLPIYGYGNVPKSLREPYEKARARWSTYQ